MVGIEAVIELPDDIETGIAKVELGTKTSCATLTNDILFINISACSDS